MLQSIRRAARSLVPILPLCAATLSAQGPPRLLGWNDLGMHCMDGDTSVFSILPPFNTFHAQLMIGGRLVVAPGYTVTYEGHADATGSINTTSIGKTDFWQHAQALFGASLQPDQGLSGFRMPGAANTPQPMNWQAASSDFKAEGVPVTPYDDAMAMRPYPLMRLVARNSLNQVVATTDIVTPVSAEMACSSCHGSGGNPGARPTNGWLHGPAATDDRMNILRLHDDRHLGDPVYAAALQAVGCSPNGLLDTAIGRGTPVLCASCHSSNALGTTGQPGVKAMTAAMHNTHATARLVDGRQLQDVPQRESCYTCHPGAATRCLRGAMGRAIGADGNAMMSCADCHGSMLEVANPARTGWLQEPDCQNCHTGDALQNAGAIRFASAFDAPGHLRTTTNARFATTPDVPRAGFSLYRFSTGHGGLECSACHGSPHAIWPSTADNDNVQSVQAQGHLGTIVECSACHTSLQDTQLVGPHGMHPTGSAWIGKHQDMAQQQGVAACQVCHGADNRGTVLSRVQADRTLTTRFGARTFYRGYQIGCYECHNGPSSDHAMVNNAPVVASLTATTPTDQPASFTLAGTDADNDPLTLRIVAQPHHGAVAFNGTTAVYRAWDGYVGPDAFSYAASDGKRNSNLGLVSLTVDPPACVGSSVTFGYGCPAPDGSVPSLRLDGCAHPGNTVTIVADGFTSSSVGGLLLGFGRGETEMTPGGCALRIGTLFLSADQLPIAAGSMQIPVPIVAGLEGIDVVLQAYGYTATAPGFVATAGLEVRIR